MTIAALETMTLSNADRRAHLCRQHQALRALVDQTRRAAFAALADDGEAGRLVSAVAALESELSAHLATEEALLGPILAGIDAWGPVRLDRLRAEHRQQRASLAALVHSGGVRVAASRAIAFCGELAEDMSFEERELFGEDVLRDDCVAVDAADA